MLATSVNEFGSWLLCMLGYVTRLATNAYELLTKTGHPPCHSSQDASPSKARLNSPALQALKPKQRDSFFATTANIVSHRASLTYMYHERPAGGLQPGDPSKLSKMGCDGTYSSQLLVESFRITGQSSHRFAAAPVTHRFASSAARHPAGQLS